MLLIAEVCAMDWNSLWQGVISNGIYALLILGGGAVLTALRLKWPNYADPARFGFVGAACVALVLFTLLGRGLFVKSPPEITPENVGENVRKWADDVGLGITKMPTSQDYYFGFQITQPSGNQITVFRGKDKSGFLQVQCPLLLSQDHLEMLRKLRKEDADNAMEEIMLEMDRARIGFVMQSASAMPLPQVTTTKPTIFQQTILVTKPIAISSGLNEASFTSHINEVDSEIGVVRLITDLTLKRYSRQTEHITRQ